MKILILTLVSLGTTACAFEPPTAEQVGESITDEPTRVLCGWKDTRTLDLDPSYPGRCIEISAPDRTTTDVSVHNPCEVTPGAKVWPSGAVVRAWAETWTDEHEITWTQRLVDCPEEQ